MDDLREVDALHVCRPLLICCSIIVVDYYVLTKYIYSVPFLDMLFLGVILGMTLKFLHKNKKKSFFRSTLLTIYLLYNIYIYIYNIIIF